MVSTTTSEKLMEGDTSGQYSDMAQEAEVMETIPEYQGTTSENRFKEKPRRIQGKVHPKGFVYPPDVETHFKAILKQGPKFLQAYADRVTQQNNSRNEFGQQAKRSLPEYYYVNSGDPASNKWLRSRSKCLRPHSRLSSASPRPGSSTTGRQSRPKSSQLPGMDNPKCFASEENNFEILSSLESLSISYRSWTAPDISLRKSALSHRRFPATRSVRFGAIPVDSVKQQDAYASLPPTPATPTQKENSSGHSFMRPQSL